MAEWRRKDPIDRMVKHVLSSGIMTEAEVDQVRKAVDDEIEAAVECAMNSPMPDPEEALEDLFVDGKAVGREGRSMA